MEVCLPSNKPAFPDKSSGGESLTTPSYSTDKNLGDISLNDLKICLTEYLNTENIEISTGGFNQSPGDNSKCNIASEDECKVSDKEKSNSPASEKSFSDSASIGKPMPSVRLSGEDKRQEDSKTSRLNDCAKSVDPDHLQYSPLPSPPKLVSAMKGSREKRGIPPRERSLTWAPNVYDPIPASVSHVPSSKNQRYRNDGRKYRKKKHKGGGGKSKDRK